MNTPRLAEKYTKEIVPAFMKERGFTNVMSIPRLEKIVVSMGVGKAHENKRLLETAVSDLTRITGQKPVVTKAKKSVSTVWSVSRSRVFATSVA